MYEERSLGTLVTKRCHLIQIKPIFLTQAGFRQDRMLAKQTPSNYYINILAAGADDREFIYIYIFGEGCVSLLLFVNEAHCVKDSSRVELG